MTCCKKNPKDIFLEKEAQACITYIENEASMGATHNQEIGATNNGEVTPGRDPVCGRCATIPKIIIFGIVIHPGQAEWPKRCTYCIYSDLGPACIFLFFIPFYFQVF